MYIETPNKYKKPYNLCILAKVLDIFQNENNFKKIFKPKTYFTVSNAIDAYFEFCSKFLLLV